jgi:hypothetical protein
MLQKLKSILLVVVLLLGGFMVPAFSFLSGTASAAQIINRSLTLEAGSTDGGSMPGGTVAHSFNFSLPSSTSLSSILFEYCTTAAGISFYGGGCTVPTGLVTTGAILFTQTGAATGFTMNNSTNGAPYITRIGATITPGTVNYVLTNIVNPTTANQTFYVRISTFGVADPSGYPGSSAPGTPTPIDTGTVAASTASQIQLTGTMPESLVFCTGGTISTTGGVPDCSTATSGAISFNQLFSPTDTAIATSQMAASTNAGSGYNITVNGPTLTSGSNTIAGMNTQTTSTHGISQFGMNLKSNTTPTVGTEVAPADNGTNYQGTATPNYGTSNSFKFTTADAVGNSNSVGSDAQIFTVSYIVNVPGSQPAGSYTTTLTYICTPTF